MLKLLFSPKGTINRNPFFMGMIICMGISLLSFILSVLVTRAIYYSILGLPANADFVSIYKASLILGSNHPRLSNFLMFYKNIILPGILFLMGVVVMWVQLCLVLKRLRDLAVAGWIAIIPFLNLILVWLFLHKGMYLNVDLVFNLSLIITLIFYALLLCWPSIAKK